ncbi:TetR/AcrR family transcriptional regulator [Solimonas terrae]|uniref:TetR/AcrR family transcriptional regulator n=1 Tax=Solimonas terrae TaxID=1396819 RepID=A0A6M2BVM5_9GAMM|nr:TetR/AcrR family transcriptional regulator [Solimonas terrae]NGY06261.1 TetR/AcrR family transcriptional regulator [Solimonas terrae]
MKVRTNKKFRQHLSTADDARSLRTREAMRGALLSLLETRSLDEIGIREIAATAGIGHATFYRHHPSKEALLHDLAAEEVQRLIALALPLMDTRGSQAACKALFTYADDNRALWSTLLTGGAAGDVREELLRIAMELVADRLPADGRAIGELGVRLLVGGTIEMLTWWLKHPAPPSIDVIARALSRGVVMPVINKVTTIGNAAVTPARSRARRRSPPSGR